MSARTYPIFILRHWLKGLNWGGGVTGAVGDKQRGPVKMVNHVIIGGGVMGAVGDKLCGPVKMVNHVIIGDGVMDAVGDKQSRNWGGGVEIQK